MMEKKMVIALALVLFVISSNMEVIDSSAYDCDDACSTGCVNRDPRLESRCNLKCQIRCGPDLKAGEKLN
ncbi:unnamed protein product [Ilex paraguariensis]|uniref:Thionin-like protein n=1 Tax=Ilex paraguariensis TaxID=185542 RepID=A0ABC8STE8_9AQUA